MPLDPQENHNQLVIDPATQVLLDRLALEKAPAVSTQTPDQARAALLKLQSEPVDMSNLSIQQRTVIEASQKLHLWIVRPNDAVSVQRAAVLYLHGAGWVMGDFATHRRLIRDLVLASGSVFIFLEYDRAPEARYPVAIKQAYAALCYVGSHSEDLLLDPARVSVAGNSVGGNMAAVLCLLARERGKQLIAAQLLFDPVTDASLDSPSFRTFAEGPWLTRTAMKWFWDQYLPDHSRRRIASVSPLRASEQELARLPKTLTLTVENDVLRDEGEAYGRALLRTGTDALTVRINGTIHDFMLLNTLAKSSLTRAALSLAAGFLREGCQRTTSVPGDSVQ